MCLIGVPTENNDGSSPGYVSSGLRPPTAANFDDQGRFHSQITRNGPKQIKNFALAYFLR